MKKTLIILFVLLPFVASGSLSYSQDSEIEEVVVIGSYLKSTPGDDALPVQVLDRNFIDSIGANSLSCLLYTSPSPRD